LGIHVLRDETKEAASLLGQLLKSGDIAEKQLLDWPVFKSFRETDACVVAFQTVHQRALGGKHVPTRQVQLDPESASRVETMSKD
jgi:hypothetical protein